MIKHLGVVADFAAAITTSLWSRSSLRRVRGNDDA